MKTLEWLAGTHVAQIVCVYVCVCVSVYGMVHIKEPLMMVEKSSPYIGGSGFHLSLSEGPLPYVRRHIYVKIMCWVRR